MKRLTPEQEVEYLKELAQDDASEKLLRQLRDSFSTLQTRSQLLLSLITLCLTITGFSGPKIAASSGAAKCAIALGIILVLSSAIILMLGPLQLRWITAERDDDIDSTLKQLIRRRDGRTRDYATAAFVLILGLASYVASLIMYLLRV